MRAGLMREDLWPTALGRRTDAADAMDATGGQSAGGGIECARRVIRPWQSEARPPIVRLENA
jgi:hypothetical protein